MRFDFKGTKAKFEQTKMSSPSSVTRDFHLRRCWTFSKVQADQARH
ncbi:MAG: hypothetical protein R3F47_18650 [Gammaproteobacteria bacterium]